MSKSLIPNIESVDFFKKLVHQKGAHVIPLEVQWEITYRCNFKCIHCYVDTSEKKEELSYSTVLKILDWLHEQGCLAISFTGGDPFARPYFIDIYRYAQKKGFLLSILTNGSLISTAMRDQLLLYPPQAIEITVNGINRKTYETISGIPGSFKEVKNAVEMLAKSGIPLVIKTIGMQPNKNQILKLKSWAQSLGQNVIFKFDPILISQYNGPKKIEALRLTPEEIITIEKSDETMKAEAMDLCLNKEKNTPSNSLFRCDAGNDSFYIDPYGNFKICPLLENPSASYKRLLQEEKSLSLLAEQGNVSFSKKTDCTDCKIFFLCRQCPGRANLEHKKPEEPVEYFCKIAHEHAELKEKDQEYL